MYYKNLLTIILTISILYFFPIYSYAQSKYSNNKLPAKLIEQMLKNHQDLALEFNSLYQGKIQNLVKDVKIKRIDFNGDKLLDYIILVNDYRFCGTGGCSLVYFYVKQPNSNYLNVTAPEDDRGVALLGLNFIKKLDKVVNGYFLLEAKVKDSSPGNIPRSVVILEFNGNQYIAHPVKK